VQEIPVGHLNERLRDLGIGCYDSSILITASRSEPLINILDLFVTRRISAVPIVDEEGELSIEDGDFAHFFFLFWLNGGLGVVLDVYEKYDALVRDMKPQALKKKIGGANFSL
jgi:CBS domain-containing protein